MHKFCACLMYKLQSGIQMTLKPKNNYRSLKHRLWAFKWYIICIVMKKLIFWCTSLKNGSKSGLVVQRAQKSAKNRFSTRFAVVCVLGGWLLIFRGCLIFRWLISWCWGRTSLFPLLSELNTWEVSVVLWYCDMQEQLRVIYHAKIVAISYFMEALELYLMSYQIHLLEICRNK